MATFRDKKTAVTEVKDWLSRLHCLVVGPGMGRNPTIIENVKVNLIREMHGLFISAQLSGRKVVLIGK